MSPPLDWTNGDEVDIYGPDTIGPPQFSMVWGHRPPEDIGDKCPDNSHLAFDYLNTVQDTDGPSIDYITDLFRCLSKMHNRDVVRDEWNKLCEKDEDFEETILNKLATVPVS